MTSSLPRTHTPSPGPLPSRVTKGSRIGTGDLEGDEAGDGEHDDAGPGRGQGGAEAAGPGVGQRRARHPSPAAAARVPPPNPSGPLARRGGRLARTQQRG